MEVDHSALSATLDRLAKRSSAGNTVASYVLDYNGRAAICPSAEIKQAWRT